MTLLVTVFATIITTIVWYKNELKKKEELKLGFLVLIYLGASLMWMVDAVFEYLQDAEGYFTPSISDMLNDTFLGFSVVALGLIIWLVKLLISDPKGILREAIFKSNK